MILQAFDTSFKILAEISPTGIYLTDIYGKCMYVNPAWCKMAGLSMSEAEGDGWVNAIHPLDRERIQTEWKSFVAGEIPWQSEYRFINNEEETTWVYGTATLFNDRNVSLQGIMGINLDITERKKSETETKERELKLRALFDHAPIGISIADSGGKILEANRELKKILKFTEDEVKSGLFKRRIYLNSEGKEISSSMFPGLIALSENQPVIGEEIGIVEANGEILWTEVSAALLDVEGKYRVVITKDITKRKAFQNKISESEAKHRTLMENCGLGIGYYDTSGKILMFNREAIKNLGGNPSDYIGKNLSEIFGKKKGQFFINRLRVAAESKVPLKYKDYVRLAGKPGWYLSTHSCIYYQNNQLEGIQVVSDNITKQINAEKKLRDSHKKLKNLTRHLENIREEERSKIALSLHDDLGQKLTALNMDITWLKGRIGIQSQAVAEKLSEMNQEIGEAIDSIKEVSSFLRPAILFELGIVSAFNWQLQKFERQAGIKCRFQCSPEELSINDRLSIVLFRILQESLTNISRHSNASAVEVNLLLVKSRLKLVIKDNGIGIHKDKIDSFKSIGITGIKERVRSVGGSTVIRGKKGVGTFVRVLIPINKN